MINLPDEFYDNLAFLEYCQLWRDRLEETRQLHFMNAHFFTHWAAETVFFDNLGCKHGQFYFFASNN